MEAQVTVLVEPVREDSVTERRVLGALKFRQSTVILYNCVNTKVQPSMPTHARVITRLPLRKALESKDFDDDDIPVQGPLVPPFVWILA